jgi:hypothetical protein
MVEDIKIIHLKSNAQQLETWIAMLNGEMLVISIWRGKKTTKLNF